METLSSEKISSLSPSEKMRLFFPEIADHALLSYETFQKYKQVGSGAFGVCFKAKSIKTNSAVAIKLIKEDSVHYYRAIQIFVAEANILGKLNHPNIVKMHGICHIPEGQLPRPRVLPAAEISAQYCQWAMVQEFMDQGTVARLIFQSMQTPHVQQFTTRQAIEWIIDITKALDYLHSRPNPIIHRDIKKENVLLKQQDGRQIAKLCDFGLSVELDGQTGCRINDYVQPCRTQKASQYSYLAYKPHKGSQNTGSGSYTAEGQRIDGGRYKLGSQGNAGASGGKQSINSGNRSEISQSSSSQRANKQASQGAGVDALTRTASQSSTQAVEDAATTSAAQNTQNNPNKPPQQFIPTFKSASANRDPPPSQQSSFYSCADTYAQQKPNAQRATYSSTFSPSKPQSTRFSDVISQNGTISEEWDLPSPATGSTAPAGPVGEGVQGNEELWPVPMQSSSRPRSSRRMRPEAQGSNTMGRRGFSLSMANSQGGPYTTDIISSEGHVDTEPAARTNYTTPVITHVPSTSNAALFDDTMHMEDGYIQERNTAHATGAPYRLPAEQPDSPNTQQVYDKHGHSSGVQLQNNSMYDQNNEELAMEQEHYSKQAMHKGAQIVEQWERGVSKPWASQADPRMNQTSSHAPANFGKRPLSRSLAGGEPIDELRPRVNVLKGKAKYGSKDFVSRGYQLSGKCGSLLYMAPEVWMGNVYTHKIDIFSLGGLLYEVLTRQSLMYATLPNGMTAHREGLEGFARMIAGGQRLAIPRFVPEAFQHIIMSCWAQRAADRPEASQVVEMLQLALKLVGSSSSKKCCCIQ